VITFTWGTMLAQLVIIAVLIYIVSRYAVKPVTGMIKKREEYITEQITSAENSRKEAEQMLAQQKAELDKARQEAKDLIERAKIQKDKEAEKIIMEAKEQSERMIQEAKLEIQREREKAVAALRNEVGALTVQLASKLLEEKLDEKGQSKLVDRYFEQVGRLQ